MRTLPDKMTTLELPSGTVTLDGHGYMIDPDAWTPEFAQHVADAEGIDMTTLHWDVIAFMHDYREDHGVSADQRFVLRYLADERGTNKHDTRLLMYELFPYGYVKQACKIAGMKQPRMWSTG